MSKQGVPLLKDDDDLYKLFTGEKFQENTVDEREQGLEKNEENFSEMLEKSLSECDNFQAILQEKERSLSPKIPSGINERLKEYPTPEVEIDLHGYTAKEAEKKAESFIRNARYNGIRTLRIIVGKGLHSQGKAVLPDVAERKVAELKKEDLVMTFQWEKDSKLKSGSMIVYLK
ncbi:MAG: Smr/MutS family protein [Candidatus Magnetomorum sp.]|nr:Smr/MutS family protein [Candidatus Magnetomorum sp.]